MTNDFEKEFLGQLLLAQGFEVWARYLFRVLEQKKFEVEEIHKDLFNCFVDIEQGNKKRLNINIPPRSGKTTLSKYFVAYTLTKNPRANIIYTSYSQSLLTDIALSCAQILEHPIYKALYPSNTTIEASNEEVNAIDDFWREYLIEETGKNTYSSKKITTKQGGTVLFSAIGGQITGYGAGVRGAKQFSGFLVIDDGNKPADIHSETMRNKVATYFKETLLSRLNDSNTPIINIQQRLNIEDLSGFLEKKYNFETVKKPLVDEQGNCLLPKQYSPERIKELQIDNYLFSSQYQQEPIILGGEIIKREWFRYYDVNFKYHYKKIVIASDTAMSTKESADRSCLMVGGITQNNTLHIIDLIVGRWDYPTLKQKAIDLWNKWQLDKRSTSASALYVEEKASGIQILQELKKTGIPILPLKADKDKYTRVQGVLEYIASGLVHLPHNEQYGFNPEILNEVESFTGNNTHLHDDVTDTLVYLIMVTIARRQVSILEVS